MDDGEGVGRKVGRSGGGGEGERSGGKRGC